MSKDSNAPKAGTAVELDDAALESVAGAGMVISGMKPPTIDQVIIAGGGGGGPNVKVLDVGDAQPSGGDDLVGGAGSGAPRVKGF